MATAYNYGPGAQYREVKLLGRGGFGTVYKVQNVSGALRVFALKLIPIPPDSYSITLIEREVGILSSLSHTNIVAVYDWKILAETRNNYFNIPRTLSNPYKYNVLCLRMELCECDIASKLKSRTRIDDAWNRKIFKQIVYGVQYLHRNDVIHRDLKPLNVLLKGETAKLTDFGLAKGGVFSWNAEHTGGLGTPLYMAPEVKRGRYDKTVDIYSLGLILIEFYTDSKDFEKWVDNLRGEITYETPMPKMNSMGNKYEALIERMTGRPSNRPTLSEIISIIR